MSQIGHGTYSCFNIRFIYISAIWNSLNKCQKIFKINVTQRLIFTQAFNYSTKPKLIEFLRNSLNDLMFPFM